jgi:hypothetical protein
MSTTTLERPRPATLTAIDRALAGEDFQGAYDSALKVRLGSAGALRRLLKVADALHQRGASDAALDILTRGFDIYPGTPRLYFQLVHVFVALDRLDDARMALELLQASTGGD